MNQRVAASWDVYRMIFCCRPEFKSDRFSFISFNLSFSDSDFMKRACFRPSLKEHVLFSLLPWIRSEEDGNVEPSRPSTRAAGANLPVVGCGFWTCTLTSSAPTRRGQMPFQRRHGVTAAGTKVTVSADGRACKPRNRLLIGAQVRMSFSLQIV